MIFGTRVRQARELRGLTQADLARACDVAQPYVGAVETGAKPASDAFAARVSAATSFPMSFFEEPAIELAPGSLLFRARASMTSRQERQARRYGEILFEAAHRLMTDLRPIPVRIPYLTAEAVSPERAARVVRSAFGYAPDEPAAALLRRAENHGVIAASVPLRTTAHEAFSTWAGDAPDLRPLIVLFACDAPDRLRFNIAHELGHLVLHKAFHDRPHVIEQEADDFASAFLLPEMAMRRELTEPLTMTSLVRLKVRWGVSMQAIARRAWRLGIIGSADYRRLCVQIAAQGWRTQEPAARQVPFERPRTLAKMAEVLFGDPVDHLALSRRLRWEPILTRELLACQASRTDTCTEQRAAEVVPIRVSPADEPEGNVRVLPTDGVPR
jgi:Zn-dependent peptidase ImmA (M78 family)/DNA-binding XRE family transcriptional regulator